MFIYIYKIGAFVAPVVKPVDGSDGAVVSKSSANGSVRTGFASWYRLQPKSGFKKDSMVGIRQPHPLLSLIKS